MTQNETPPLQARVLRCAQLGLCRVDLVEVTEGSDRRWMVFFQTPNETRVDTLSRVLRKAGGHFGSLNDHLGLVYHDEDEAARALQLLLDTIAREAGRPESLPN